MDTTDTTLVIGDAHVDPRQLRGDGLRRFRWLNRYLQEHPPSRVVEIGDFLTCDSITHWDKDKPRRQEGKRFFKDVEALDTALGVLSSNKVGENIPFIKINGNHEDWINQYVDRHPEMEEMLDIEPCFDWAFDKVTYVPYKSDWKHKGVSFTHVPIMENGRPVSGKNAVYRALDIYHNSVVFGHTHKLDMACVARHNSPHLNQAINVGCFFEHIDDYALGSVTSYWRGVVLLKHISNNRVDVETISMSQLKREYGDERT